MPFGLAVVLWAVELMPPGPAIDPASPAVRPLAVSAADLARTDAALRHAAVLPLPAAGPPHDMQRLAVAASAPADLALLLGDRSRGGQLEMGALGGGRADAPGLIHVGVGIDF